MTKKRVFFIGDVHGLFPQYLTYCERLTDLGLPSIQVGDYGVGFQGWKSEREYLDPDNLTKNNHRFIRGNHDSPRACKEMPNWIRDGHVEVIGESKVMFVGGGWSIDREFRIEGHSWWPDEECSYETLGFFISKYETEKPDVMVTHECPTEISRHLFGDTIKNIQGSRTANSLQNMFEIHKPKLWVFGHFHMSKDVTVLGTRFICLDELELAEIEL